MIDLINQIILNSFAFGIMLASTIAISAHAIGLAMGFLSKVA